MSLTAKESKVFGGRWERLCELVGTTRTAQLPQEQPTWPVIDEYHEQQIDRFATTSIINAANAQNKHQILHYGEVCMHNVVDSLFPYSFYCEQLPREINCCKSAIINNDRSRISPYLKTSRYYLADEKAEKEEGTKAVKEEEERRKLLHQIEIKERIKHRDQDMKKAVKFVRDIQETSMTFFTIIGGPYIRNSILLKVPANAGCVVEFLGQKLEAVAKTEQEPRASTLEDVADIPEKPATTTSPSEDESSSAFLLQSCKVALAAKEGEDVGCILDIAPFPVQHCIPEELSEVSQLRVYYNLSVKEEREKMMLTCRAIQSQVMLMAKESGQIQSQGMETTKKQHLDVKPLLGFHDIEFQKIKCSTKAQVVRIIMFRERASSTRILKKRSKEDAAIEVDNIKALQFTGMVPQLYHHDDRGFTITSDCGKQCSPSVAVLLEILSFVEQAHDKEIVLFDLKFANFCSRFEGDTEKVFLVDLEYARKTSELLVNACPGTNGYRCFKLVEAARQEGGFHPHKGYDMFSLGVMLSEVIQQCLRKQFSRVVDPRMLSSYFNDLKAGRESDRPSLDEDAVTAILAAVKELIEWVERCLDKDLDKRPTVTKLKTALAENILFK